MNHTITNVKYDDHGVTVVTKNGDIVKAEYAISTFSVGVMQNHDIKWTPKLPDWKKEGFFGFHMATYTKIFLNFPKQFWDNNQYTVWADPDRRGYMSVWQNLNAPGFFPKGTSTNIFFVTLTQDWSYAAESMTDKEVQDEMMVVLKKMYGDDIPEPTEIMFPRWHSNPLFRGSYSNWPIGELDQHHANMKAPIKNRLFFAGEALSTEYYGFLQGAWFTGAEAADSIAKCIDDKCPEAEYYPIITLGSEKPSLVRRAFL